MPMMTYLSHHGVNLTDEWMAYVLIGTVLIGIIAICIVVRKFDSKI